jgi:hemerythrin
MNILPYINESAEEIIKTDEEHIKFAGYINRLYEAILSSKRKEVIALILEGLAVYTFQQFRSEEQLMVTTEYHDYQTHKSQHTKLLNKIIDFKIKYKEGNYNLGFELAEFLNKYLIAHIASYDKTLCNYLDETGK